MGGKHYESHHRYIRSRLGQASRCLLQQLQHQGQERAGMVINSHWNSHTHLHTHTPYTHTCAHTHTLLHSIFVSHSISLSLSVTHTHSTRECAELNIPVALDSVVGEAIRECVTMNQLEETASSFRRRGCRMMKPHWGQLLRRDCLRKTKWEIHGIRIKVFY